MKLAIIPARGGSQRIPRKNIRLFHGRPMLAYSIAAARESGLFDHIIVSTDDEEIAQAARDWGAETPFMRPAELAGDRVSTKAVTRHAVRWYQHAGYAVDFACCIYATAPFLQGSFLRQALDLLLASGKQFVFSVATFPFPIQRGLRITPAGYVEAMHPEYIDKRSQDLPEIYHDAGQFYWGRAEAYLNNDVIFSAASKPFILPRHYVQDIDTPEDWHRAELMYRVMQLSGSIKIPEQQGYVTAGGFRL